MSAADQLDDIEVRLLSPMVTYKENATGDSPVLVAALRAVLLLHAPNGMPVNLCRHDRLPYDLCPTVRAITAALDGTS